MSPSLDAVIGDPQYPRLKELVVESTGLSYYSDKDAELARRVEHRLAVTGIQDCASYLDILRDPTRGASERDALIAEVTIGETYFFRHREHFDALRNLVLPDLIARNRVNRRLRIWSAGCSDGPEPYSLAILLKQEMGQQLLGWEVTILGTDINRQGLARAREGKFEEWALRSISENLKRRCFSKEGKVWSIAPEYKEWVSFRYFNLVEDSFPSLLKNIFSFDLIVCRNVMIYFGPELMQKMVQKFYDCLVPRAWLLVGPSEPNMIHFTSFHAVNAPGVTLYQKPDEPAIGHEPSVFRMPCLPPPPPTPEMAHSEDRSVLPTLEDLRCYANEGDWENAATCCEHLLKMNNLNSSVHFYQALILQQMGKHDDAERSLRRAIYLDRKSVLAHYYLGLFLQSRGDTRQAERSFENALELLGTRSDRDVFVDADGVTAAELKKLARMHLYLLRKQV